MRLVVGLERADLPWCAIGGVAVNHWAAEPMVTQELEFVVTPGLIDKAVAILSKAGIRSERFPWFINFKGQSKVSLQLSAKDFYRDFPSRSVPADVHGILLRVASLEDTLKGKIKVWSDSERRQSKRLKDLGDLARLVETHPRLWEFLTPELQQQIAHPLRACFKTRPVRAPGLQAAGVAAQSCRPRALTRRGAGVLKHALRDGMA